MKKVELDIAAMAAALNMDPEEVLMELDLDAPVEDSTVVEFVEKIHEATHPQVRRENLLYLAAHFIVRIDDD